MAFSTEFVMGAGGAVEVEEIPVSMNGGGNGTVYPLTTVNAGAGAIVFVAGTLTPGSTLNAGRPHLRIGSHPHEEPHAQLSGPAGLGLGARVTGSVQVAVLSRSVGATSFTGMVYVARL